MQTLETDMSLEALGWNARWQEKFEANAGEGLVRARVVGHGELGFESHQVHVLLNILGKVRSGRGIPRSRE